MTALQLQSFRRFVERFAKAHWVGVNAVDAWFLPLFEDLAYDAWDIRDCEEAKERMWAAMVRTVLNMKNIDALSQKGSQP